MGDARPVLMQLIDEKLLTPGAKKLYVSYYRKRVYADLLTDGSIRFKDTIYISPVPCALQMKRTLNPSLKTDAGWSTMFSAASGESLKDIKDRLNIRKRGPNSRTVNKDKKLAQAGGVATTTTTKATAAGSSAASSTAESARQLASALQRCSGCKKEATADFATCTACKRRTHFQCAHPVLEKAPTGSWFCDGCITDQANRILDFLNQTRRVLANRSTTETIDVDDDHHAATDAESATEADPEPLPSDASKTANEEDQDGDDDSTLAADSEAHNGAKDQGAEASADAESTELPTLSELSSPMKSLLDESALASADVPSTKLPVKERFIGLLDQLIEEISSKSERTDVITNSTGASLVHLAKTDLVNLVERGLAEMETASKKSESKRDDEDEEEADEPAASNAFDVDELVRLFDFRHEILQSKRQFEHTTKALVDRGEQRLRVAETELMELEETRTNESNAVMKIANLIDQYTSDLKNCQERIRLNQVLLESVMQRRKFIRSSNVSNVFLPAYRLIAKHMITSSDQLLVTVMLDKLRDIARMINEWEKMESHFETMSAKLQERLDSMKVKKESEDPGRAPSPVPLFARVKIPPSRRLLERQIANYKSNLKAISANRMRIRHTLQVTLKIAKDESLGGDVVETTEILLKKCGGPIITEEPEVEKVEDIDEEGGLATDGVEPNNEDKRPREEERTSEQEAKRQRVEVAIVDPVKPEPATRTSPESQSASSVPNAGPGATQAPVASNSTTTAPIVVEPTATGRLVEVLDSEDSDAHGNVSSEEGSSPKTIHHASANDRQPLAQMQSLESVRVKKELVEQATRQELHSAPFTAVQQVPQRKEANHTAQRSQASEPAQARKGAALNGSASSGQLNAWEAAMPRAEPTYREQSPSLYQQSQQQQQQQQQMQLQQQLQQQQQQQAQQRAQEQAKAKASSSQSRSQEAAIQQTNARFPMPSNDMQQHQMRQAAPQMSVEPPKQQRREAEQQRKNQRAQQQVREDVLRPQVQQEHQQQNLPHAFQMPQAIPSHQARQPQSQGASRSHQVSPVRDPFPQLPIPTQSRTNPSQTFSALSDSHQPGEFGQQRHHAGLASTAVDSQSQHGFQQQQQQQQFQRFQQQQQQQQQQHAGMLHGSGVTHRAAGAGAGGHPLFGDMPKPPSMTSSSIPTPQDLFGNHSQSQSSDESMGLAQPTRSQPVAARQAQQQQQHSFQQQQQQMLHHAHHLNPTGTSMGQHHAQSHPLASVGSMGAQFNDPSAMRSTYLPSTNDSRANNAGAFAYGDASHMMHHAHNDVFASHMGQQQQQQQQQQQAPSMHHLFQNDVGARGNADFQAHFNSRMFRDPTTDNQMNHPGMDGAPDMSEW